ncbi:MAG: 16S rRNA (cytidine(1402)-2'-O)-methyltransferase [Clostridia bacterium]|nr:16S rRNA (cytidine(1402)-2'-O)-methyltransferase [Clostridia bacterium]
MSGMLYVVGTPIGNLNDFSPRGLETLQEVDFIAAEDTRVTLKLLNRFEIKKPLISYHEHNRFEKGTAIVERILAGESCALVTDAGMPAISDPGEELVLQCHLAGVPVVSVPGPSALITALAISGMPSGRFTFEGFLSMNKRSRREHLQEIVNEPRTMIFYEAPHKLLATLKDMFAVLGDRKLALVRELTKIHEDVFRTTLAQAIEHYTQNQPKGEFVLIVNGCDPVVTQTNEFTLEQAAEIAKEKMEQGITPTLASKMAAEISGFKKNDIYAYINKNK